MMAVWLTAWSTLFGCQVFADVCGEDGEFTRAQFVRVMVLEYALFAFSTSRVQQPADMSLMMVMSTQVPCFARFSFYQGVRAA